MTSNETFDPASIAEEIQGALLARFPGPIRLEGVLVDWRTTPKFGRGKLTADGDTSAQLPIGMQMWRLGGGKAHLEKGQHVTVIGELQWHATFGLQLMANTIRSSGVADQHQAVQDLRRKLRDRNYQSPQRRLNVGQPARIAVLAPHGGAAALTDARATLADLSGNVHLFSHRIPMGGPAAPTAIAQALLSLSRSADLILIVRGGGSTTDLAVWDNPAVVSRISACPVPVIMGVGHSIDTTAAGLAAHHSAITPTAAAQWVADRYSTAPRPDVPTLARPTQPTARTPVMAGAVPTPDAPRAHNRRVVVGPLPAAAALIILVLLVALVLL